MEKTVTKPQLTISLLASNRPDSIRKCLDSLRPIMEQIPSELILVDTSKNSQIHEILLEYTNQVYEFEWCNDFSKARNIGLKNAKGEWFLFLDDDEWFVEIDELVNFFRSGEYKEYGYANYQVRNFYDPNYMYYSDSWVSRMIRIDKDTEFRSKIHEYMYPVRGKCKNIYALAYHSGYIFATEEKKRAHFERNTSLLLDMIKEEPDNLRWQVQLAQEYRSVKEWKRLCEYCAERIEANQKVDDNYNNVHLGTFYAGYLEGLLQLKDYAQAMIVCEQALRDKRSTELCKAMMHLRLAEVYLCTEKWDKAREYTNLFLKESKVLQANEKVMLFQTMALLVNEAFDDTNIKKAYSILIACGIKEGSKVELLEYYDKLEWNLPVLYVYTNTQKYIVEAMATMEYDAIFSRIVTDAFHNSELRELMVEAAGEWQKEENAFRRVMYAYAQAEVDDWYIWYAKLQMAGFENDRELCACAVREFCRTFVNVFAIPKEILEIAEKLGANIYENWREVLPDRWKVNVREYIGEAGKKHLMATMEKLDEVFSKDDWKYQFFQLTLCEVAVAKGPKEPWNLTAYYETLQQLVETSLAFYGNYYKQEVFTCYPELLPENVQAALKIMEYLELEPQNVQRALESLAESAMVCVEWSEGIRKFIEQYPKLGDQREKKRKQELHQLRDQVMEQVESMLAKGQTKEALVIIAQLKQMVPDDLGVIELGLRARLQSLEE